MELLEIKKYPEKILRKKCKPINQVDRKENVLFNQMLFTMRHFSGIGLAGPQVGILKRLIVAEVGGEIIKLANPEILKVKGADRMEEGCLSVPDMGVDIERSYEIIVKGLDEKGKTVEMKVRGLLARVLQHEIDHLRGKLIIDYLPFWAKLRLKVRGNYK